MRKKPVWLEQKAGGAIAVIAVAVLFGVFLETGPVRAENTNSTSTTSTNGTNSAEPTIELLQSQTNAIKVDTVGTYLFPLEKEAVGNIGFDDDLSVQVFPPNQGKLLKTFVELGDNVQKGQPLYTIDSPDLLQAESTLIGAEATLKLTDKELTRAKELSTTNGGVSQRELEQALNDQQTAEGAFKAARDAVRIFGKTDEEIDQIISTRKIDSALIVRSPINGQVTAKSAPPGILVQPGTPPAPFSVADVSVKWMMANVAESDSPLYREGQPLKVRVMAYPDRVFEGRISKIYATVDPNTHTVLVRSEVTDSKNELRSGMLANFLIRVQDPVEATAIPVNGVVREGDGTMTAWITTDGRHFTQRTVKLGLQNSGKYQVLAGLHPGELAVTDGAIFLDNMLQAPPTD